MTDRAGQLVPYTTEFKVETVNFERSMQALAEASGGNVDIFKLAQLRVPSGGGMQWQLDTGYESTLHGVIVFHHPMRSYWSEAFGTRQSAPPDCQSFDGVHGYGNPGGQCVNQITRQAICPFAEFGTKPASSPKGTSRAPACKNSYALYIVTPQSALPMVFMAPGVSINPVRNYLKALAAQGYFPVDVVTSFELEQARNAEGILFSKVLLRPVGLTSEALQKALQVCAQTLRATLQAQTAFVQSFSAAALPSASQTPEERQADRAAIESSAAQVPGIPTGVGRLMFHDDPEEGDDDITDPGLPHSVTS